MPVPVSAAVTNAPPTIAEAGIHLRRGLVAAVAAPFRSAGSPVGVG
jgi:hypothetical protein